MLSVVNKCLQTLILLPPFPVSEKMVQSNSYSAENILNLVSHLSCLLTSCVIIPSLCHKFVPFKNEDNVKSKLLILEYSEIITGYL